MFVSKELGKNAQMRFNLLLLEDGEFFLDDFSVYRFLDPTNNIQRYQRAAKKTQGRLKVCTRGFFFEPQDLHQPILRFPFREMQQPPLAEIMTNPSASDSSANDVFVVFECKTILEMKERGVDHPYVTRETTGGLDSSQAVPSKYYFSLLHSRIQDFLRLVEPIWQIATRKDVLNKIEEEQLLQPILEPRLSNHQFDPSLLVDFRERPLLAKSILVDRIGPLLKFPGCLMLTNQRLYFQPAQVNNVGDPVLNWSYQSIQQVYKRRHMLKQTGLEFFFSASSSSANQTTADSVFLSFRTRRARDEIFSMLLNQPELAHCRESSMDLSAMVLKWQRREVSNYEYLLYLNNAAGRTKNDLTQYPVFPWVLQDYTSAELDLTNPQVFRDLSKPIGALNEERLEFFKARFDNMPSATEAEAEGLPPPFLYGTHYSTPGYVLFYLVRMAPQYMLCLQNGKFDAPDRLFKSIPQTWSSCLTNHADLKELIPAFFDEQINGDEWLLNTQNLDLGTTQNHERVGDVELPPWASSPLDFIRKNRDALESEYVSAHLHEWIDLIFGFKQRGQAAIQADNLFYYLSYEGSVDLETITDPVQKCSFEAQIQEFGQTPKLLFKGSHPSRNDASASVETVPLDVETTLTPYETLNASASIQRQPNALLTENQNINDHQQDDDEEEEGAAIVQEKRSMFGFRTRSFPGVPKQAAQRLVGGLAAQWRKRMVTEPVKKWNWHDFPVHRDDSDASCWDGSSPQMVHTGEITSVVLTRDTKWLLTASKDTNFRVSSSNDFALRRQLSCKLALACCDISPSEKQVFLGSWDNCVYMYSIEFGRVVHQVTAHDDGLSALCVCDDRFLVTSSWDGTIKLWIYSNTEIQSVPVHTFMECEDSVLCLDVCVDGSYAVAGTTKGVVYLFDLRSHELMLKVDASPQHNSEVAAVGFAGNGASFVTVTVDNEVRQFNLDGLCIGMFQAQLDGQIRCFRTDGEFAVGGTSNGKLLFWHLGDAFTSDESSQSKCLYEDAHNCAVSSLALTPNGALLVSGGADGSLRIWKQKKKTPSRSRLSLVW